MPDTATIKNIPLNHDQRVWELCNRGVMVGEMTAWLQRSDNLELWNANGLGRSPRRMNVDVRLNSSRSGKDCPQQLCPEFFLAEANPALLTFQRARSMTLHKHNDFYLTSAWILMPEFLEHGGQAFYTESSLVIVLQRAGPTDEHQISQRRERSEESY